MVAIHQPGQHEVVVRAQDTLEGAEPLDVLPRPDGRDPARLDYHCAPPDGLCPRGHRQHGVTKDEKAAHTSLQAVLVATVMIASPIRTKVFGSMHKRKSLANSFFASQAVLEWPPRPCIDPNRNLEVIH